MFFLLLLESFLKRINQYRVYNVFTTTYYILKYKRKKTGFSKIYLIPLFSSLLFFFLFCSLLHRNKSCFTSFSYPGRFEKVLITNATLSSSYKLTIYNLARYFLIHLLDRQFALRVPKALPYFIIC